MKKKIVRISFNKQQDLVNFIASSSANSTHLVVLLLRANEQTTISGNKQYNVTYLNNQTKTVARNVHGFIHCFDLANVFVV